MRTAKINGKEYPIHFSVKALHEFAKGQGIDDVAQALASLSFLGNFKPGHSLTITDFEKVSLLAEAVIGAGARKEKKTVDVDSDAIYEMLMQNPDSVRAVVEEVVDGLNSYLEVFAGDKKKATTSKRTK